MELEVETLALDLLAHAQTDGQIDDFEDDRSDHPSYTITMPTPIA